MRLPWDNRKTESFPNKLEGMVQVCYSKKFRENPRMKQGLSSWENITVAEKLLYELQGIGVTKESLAKQHGLRRDAAQSR